LMHATRNVFQDLSGPISEKYLLDTRCQSSGSLPGGIGDASILMDPQDKIACDGVSAESGHLSAVPRTTDQSSHSIVRTMTTAIPSPSVLVLGMHRSGTSATAAALHHLGYSLGSSLYGPNQWNPKGYFEDQSVVRFNDELLGLMQRRWDSALPPLAVDFDAIRDQRPRAMELLQSRFASTPLWGLKDPRMCLLEPFWSETLRAANVDTRCLITIRNPAHVARSLMQRDGIGAHRAAWLWLTYTVAALRYAKRPGMSRFLSFDSLIEKPATQCRELATWLGLAPNESSITAFATEFIAPELAHRGEHERPEIPALATEAFQLLSDAAAAAIDPCDFAAGNAWQAILAAIDREVTPTLQLVHRFYQSDRQLDVSERRMAAVTLGLETAQNLAITRAQTISLLEQSLSSANASVGESNTAAAEHIANETASDIQRLEAIHATSEAATRTWQEQLKTRDDKISQLTRLLDSAEGLATERLSIVAARDEQLRRTEAAFAHAEKLALERFAEIKVLTQRLGDLQSPPRAEESTR